MNIELKPCPFCGNKATITYKQVLEAYICECSNNDCPASYMIGNIYDTMEEAIEVWNRRVNNG